MKYNVSFSAFRMSCFVNFFLWALDTLHSPPETGRFIEHEQLLFDRQTSLFSGDAFFLKLRLKLLDLDLTISDRTIILISALFLSVSFHKNLCLLWHPFSSQCSKLFRRFTRHKQQRFLVLKSWHYIIGRYQYSKLSSICYVIQASH